MLSFPQVSDNDSKDKTADAKDSFYDSRDCGFITNTQITIPHPSCDFAHVNAQDFKITSSNSGC